MNLIIDSGNTRVKFYETQQNQISDPHIFVKTDRELIKEYITKVGFEKVISSNVGQDDQLWENIAKSKAKTYIYFNHKTPIPINNKYQTPETLGYDRLAAAVGAAQLFPKRDILIIDFGTAITYDIVSNDNFLGGAIAPGMEMRFEALNQFTSKLPKISASSNFNIPGKTTKESILNGVVQGINNEVTGTINSYRKEYSELITVITGGDMEFFAKIIKNGIFAEPKLIAKGLNNILNYNVEKS